MRMKRLVLSGVLACAALVVTGCRGNQAIGGAGGASGTGDVPSSDMATASAKTYMKTTVAAMRMMASAHIDVELDGVISLGVTSSSKSPKIFVQDAGGGDFSAVVVHCQSGSTSHPCTLATANALHGIQDGRVINIQGTYSKSKSGFETVYVDSVTDVGPGKMPSPTSVTLADVARGANNTKLWFQYVSVSMGTTTLKGYDWSPAEFKYTGGSGGCPAMFGWGMVPSTSADSIGSACNATTQPASAVSGMPPADEYFIGTDFYDGFTYSSDCACAGMFKDTLIAATNTVSGKLTGILIGDVPYMQTTSYQYIAPKSNSDITIQ
jgi:hypothetical protein